MFESTTFDDGKNRECARLLRMCAEIHHAPHLSDPDIAAYFNAVHCTDTDTVYQALQDWYCRGRHFPSPEDIRLRIRKLDEDKKRPEDVGTQAEEDRIRPLGAPRLPGSSCKCGSNSDNPPAPRPATRRAGARSLP